MSQSGEVEEIQDPAVHDAEVQELKERLETLNAVSPRIGNDAPIQQAEVPPPSAEKVEEEGDILTEPQADAIRADQEAGVPQIRTQTEPEAPVVSENVYQYRPVPFKKVRWFYQEKLDGPIHPLSDHDSILLEVKWRCNNGNVDTEVRDFALSIKDAYTFRPATDLSKRRNSVIDENYDDPYTTILIHHRLYRANTKTKEAYPLYWNRDKIDEMNEMKEPIEMKEPNEMKEPKEINEIHLIRGVYMINGQPIDSDLAERIENAKTKDEVKYGVWYHLAKDKCEAKGKIVFYKNGQIDVKLKDTVQMLENYSPEAKWDPNHANVGHLVFATHGIWNDGNPQGIVESAKLLNRGINQKTEPGQGVVVIPIHWRTGLRKHDCPPSKIIPKMVKMGKFLSSIPLVNEQIKKYIEDVQKYECKECAPMIRKVVITKIKEMHAKFQHWNPTFKGTVSLLGHSLGSVICYDILTMEDDLLKPKEDDLLKPKEDDLLKPKEDDLLKPKEDDLLKPKEDDLLKPKEDDLLKPKEDDLLKPKEDDQPEPKEDDLLKPWPKMEKFFAIGSPLATFIDDRGDEAKTVFRNAVKNMDVYNIFHRKDTIADRLERIIHSDNEKEPPVTLSSHPVTIHASASGSAATSRVLNAGFRVASYIKKPIGGSVDHHEREPLQNKIDHEVEELPNKNCDYHTCYWYHDCLYRLVATVFARHDELYLKRDDGGDNESQKTSDHDSLVVEKFSTGENGQIVETEGTFEAKEDNNCVVSKLDAEEFKALKASKGVYTRFGSAHFDFST
ncbi:hypothetical protein B9Z55_008755 [Caenorhabditis nigoni]|uniref:DDHD domain-containing protein n=1 Tax=Caenorhabditis nigoni TaxID=1611254 RepID=A0A2G5UNY8_9PELO|nr:hypothetical protein B9Z55_008755 [Caenorhabditis nigoni]